MSQPDHDAIVNEIRSAQITASPELRERVRGLAAADPPAAPSRQNRELPWRRCRITSGCAISARPA